MNAPFIPGIRVDLLNPRLRVLRGGSVRGVVTKRKTTKATTAQPAMVSEEKPAWRAALDVYVWCSAIAREERTPEAVTLLEQSRAVLVNLAKRAGKDPSQWTWQEAPKLSQEPRVDAVRGLLAKCEEVTEVLRRSLDADDSPGHAIRIFSFFANVLCGWLDGSGLSKTPSRARNDWFAAQLRTNKWSNAEDVARLALRAVGYEPKEAWGVVNTTIVSPRATEPKTPDKQREKSRKSKLGSK